jgi:hypothetical protein
MAEYRCHFFGAARSSPQSARPGDETEIFHADNDDAARLAADSLCRGRRGPVLGFEVWQASRLVCREAKAAGSATPRDAAT